LGYLASSFLVSLAKADFGTVLPHDTSLTTSAANLSVIFWFPGMLDLRLQQLQIERYDFKQWLPHHQPMECRGKTSDLWISHIADLLDTVLRCKSRL
jgi:hypothetical protein